MELSRIFRMMLEGHGIEYLGPNLSVNYLTDLSTLSASSIYLWRSILRDGLVHEFISTNGSKYNSDTLAYRYSQQTGFDLASIRSLLSSLSLGMKQAYWGIEPHDENISLTERYLRNRTIWHQRLSLYQKGVLRIKSNGKYGFITSDGEPFIEPQYKDAALYREELACVIDSENRAYFINILGNVEIKLDYIEVNTSTKLGQMEGGTAIYMHNGKYGLINRDGNHSESLYDYIPSQKSSVMVVHADQKCGLIHREDFSAITLLKYDEIKPFMDDMQPYTEARWANGQRILLSREGHEVSIEENVVRIWFIDNLVLMYESSGRLVVMNDNLESKEYHYGSIMDEKIRINFVHIAHEDTTSPILYFRSRYGYYSSGRGYLFIKSDGTVLNKTVYSMAYQFIEGIAWVKKGYKWYRINAKGDELRRVRGFDVLTPEYRGRVIARNLSDGLLVVLANDGTVIYTFPESEDSEPVMNRHYQYVIETHQIDFVWYKGVLTKVEGKISNSIRSFVMMTSNYVLNKLDEGLFEIYDLLQSKSYEFSTRNQTDCILHSVRCSNFRRGCMYCKTLEGKLYLVDVSTNNFSECFDEFREGSIVPIGIRDGKDFLLGTDLNIVVNYDEIL